MGNKPLERIKEDTTQENLVRDSNNQSRIIQDYLDSTKAEDGNRTGDSIQ